MFHLTAVKHGDQNLYPDLIANQPQPTHGQRPRTQFWHLIQRAQSFLTWGRSVLSTIRTTTHYLTFLRAARFLWSNQRMAATFGESPTMTNPLWFTIHRGRWSLQINNGWPRTQILAALIWATFMPHGQDLMQTPLRYGFPGLPITGKAFLIRCKFHSILQTAHSIHMFSSAQDQMARFM